MGSATFYPAVSGDDGSWNNAGGGHFYGSSPPYGSLGNGGADTYSFIRFANVTIPPGATITLCQLKLTATGTTSDNPYAALTYPDDYPYYPCAAIKFNDVDNAVAPTTAAGGNALVRTASEVDFADIGNWTAGDVYILGDLKVLLQAVINRGGFASGNAVQVIIENAVATDENWPASPINSVYNGSRNFAAIDYASGAFKPELYVEWEEGAMETLPLLTIQGELEVAETFTATGSFILPALSFHAEGGGYFNIVLPKATFAAQGSTNTISRINISLPRLQFAAHALQEGISYLNVTLPKLQFNATGFLSPIASLLANLPLLKFSAHGLTGVIGELNAVLPRVQFRANAYWQGTNTLNIVLPKIIFHARARSNDVLTLVINTKNFALTEYDNSYDYNSLLNFNGKLVGMKRDGIYELNGDTDNGDPIDWYFKTGKLDLEEGQVKKARYVWLSYRPSGDLILVVDDGENEYEYDVESYKQIDNAVRIKLGKGIRNRYIQLELRNVSDEKIFLDRLRLFTEPIAKKR